MYENNLKDIIEVQQGNEEALERMIQNNSGLLWSIVRRFKERGYELEDLYQIAVMGFIKSIKRFDTNFDVKLSTYAVPYILGELKRFIRDDGPIKVSRGIQETLVRIREVQKEYTKRGEEIGIEEIASILKISKEDVIMAMESINNVDSIYDEAYTGKDGSITIMESLATGKDEELETVNKICLRKLVSELGDRDKQIIMLRYYKGKTQTEVARILGITQVHVSRLERKILQRMRSKLTG